MRFLLLSIVSIMLLVTIPESLSANTARIKMSPALTTVMKQAEQTYLIPFGWRMQSADPKSVAALLGLAMHRQKIYIEERLEYLDHFGELVKEIDSYLDSLANYYGNRDPKDGSYIDGEILSEKFYNALMGGMNEWVKRTKNINPSHVNQPFMINQVIVDQHISPPDRVPESLGVFVEQEDEPDAIVLLGQRAERVTNNIGTNPTFSIPRTKPQKVQKTPIRKGVIAGRWQKVDNYSDSCRVAQPIKREPYYINFRRGNGKSLYTAPLDITVYRVEKYNYVILSEKQIDPYKIEYKSKLLSQNSRSGSSYHNQGFVTTIFRDDKNRLILCRNSIWNIGPNTYMK